MFDGETITFEDDRKDYGERRYITLGLLERWVIVVVHTYAMIMFELFLWRKANEREKKIYYERLKKN